MFRSRHSALIRVPAFLFLLWIGLDFGAHGFLASDAAPLASGSAAFSAQEEQGPAGTCGSNAHCFCHSISVGAVVPVCVAELTLVGQTVSPLPTLAPQTDRHPLDLPPRFIA